MAAMKEKEEVQPRAAAPRAAATPAADCDSLGFDSVSPTPQSSVLVPETQESQSSPGDGEESQSSWLSMDGAVESDPPPASQGHKEWNRWNGRRNSRRYARRDAKEQGKPYVARSAATYASRRSKSDEARRIDAEAARAQAQEDRRHSSHGAPA